MLWSFLVFSSGCSIVLLSSCQGFHHLCCGHRCRDVLRKRWEVACFPPVAGAMVLKMHEFECFSKLKKLSPWCQALFLPVDQSRQEEQMKSLKEQRSSTVLGFWVLAFYSFVHHISNQFYRVAYMLIITWIQICWAVQPLKYGIFCNPESGRNCEET